MFQVNHLYCDFTPGTCGPWYLILLLYYSRGIKARPSSAEEGDENPTLLKLSV